ncbi:hypothetical protein PV05_07006 [Exophiala xenobiotica]|uniref:Uncharacterized protein n=1 Tax=Exophiala xenobiotica TaxID=348802 RepID=A0A0D2EGW3_9EURO|nr:uncharacterized protein PV05_07006 [Exophiala xenobiotica]KIW54658.1 hypothetical protein PV05_07006 [Exophiala xenobiotica]
MIRQIDTISNARESLWLNASNRNEDQEIERQRTPPQKTKPTQCATKRRCRKKFFYIEGGALGEKMVIILAIAFIDIKQDRMDLLQGLGGWHWHGHWHRGIGLGLFWVGCSLTECFRSLRQPQGWV